MTTKDLRALVTQKRDAVLKKHKLPAKIPRGRQALIDICKKFKK